MTVEKSGVIVCLGSNNYSVTEMWPGKCLAWLVIDFVGILLNIPLLLHTNILSSFPFCVLFAKSENFTGIMY